MRLQIIQSPKHPGAVFLKVHGSKDDFVAKFYPGKEKEAYAYKRWIEQDVVTDSAGRQYLYSDEEKLRNGN